MKKVIITESQFKNILEATQINYGDFKRGFQDYMALQKQSNTAQQTGQQSVTFTNGANLGDNSLPRGYRNNNPLNIRISNSNAWQGKVANNTDGAFEQFQAPQYGYRAAIKLLKNYIKSGRNTVYGIISKWAPNNENNTNGYINRVCITTGFSPNTVINPESKEQMCKLVYAMAIVENGNNIPGQPNMQEINGGFDLA